MHKIKLEISLNTTVEEKEVISLYKSNAWSSAKKPKELLAALRNSHTLVIARISGKLVGIGYAISDGHLVVYYPHMLVDPDYQGKGIGRKMMEAMQTVYGSFHQQMITSDGEAVKFYKKLGFEHAEKLNPCGSIMGMTINIIN